MMKNQLQQLLNGARPNVVCRFTCARKGIGKKRPINCLRLPVARQAETTTVITRLLTNSAIFVLDFYRNYISCLMLPRCRFHPTCSAYAQESIKKKGLWRGLALSLWRLLRCHPFSRAPFYDPVDKDQIRGVRYG